MPNNSPDDKLESLSKCKATVWNGESFSARRRPCERNASTPAGYCKQHDPELVKARNAERDARWKRESEINNKRWRLEAAAQDLLDACKTAYENTPDGPVAEKLKAAIDKAEKWR